jgi:hypothetical protein
MNILSEHLCTLPDYFLQMHTQKFSGLNDRPFWSVEGYDYAFSPTVKENFCFIMPFPTMEKCCILFCFVFWQ